ncbi:MAG: hypothetical protein EBE86_012055 [Hormoscilla sp. GUM202]|nr:hypothetical protein [Hormoscilla sp. GUM202]
MAAEAVSDWHGVTVVGDRVTKIQLSQNDLSGTLPSGWKSKASASWKIPLSEVSPRISMSPTGQALLGLPVITIVPNGLACELLQL